MPSIFTLSGPLGYATDYRGEVRWYLIHAHSMTPAKASKVMADYRSAIASGKREKMHPGAAASHIANLVREIPSQVPSKTPSQRAAIKKAGSIKRFMDDVAGHLWAQLDVTADEARRWVADMDPQLLRDDYWPKSMPRKQRVIEAARRVAGQRGRIIPTGTGLRMGQRREAFEDKVKDHLYQDGFTHGEARAMISASPDVIDMYYAGNIALKQRIAAAAKAIRKRGRRASVKPASVKRLPSKKGGVSAKWAEKHLPEGWQANVPSQVNPDRFCAARTWLGLDKPRLKTIRYRAESDDPKLIQARHYEVCLSRNQAQRLFSTGAPVTKKYGGAGPPAYKDNAGTYAGVWKKGDKDILKITKDAEDVGALLRTGNLRHVRRISKAYLLVDAGYDCEKTARESCCPEGRSFACSNRNVEPTPLFAIVSEDVDPVEGHSDPKIERYGQWIDSYWRGDIFGFAPGPMAELHDYAVEALGVYEGRPQAPANVVRSFSIPRSLRNDFYAKCRGRADQADCRTFTREFLDTWTKMARKGVIAYDMHHGNIGVSAGRRTKAGTWMIIDAGLSSQEPPPEKITELRAAWRRRADREDRHRSALRNLVLLGAATIAVVSVPLLVR
ncbi:MAG: hypothetical protein JSV86_06040 [Gemmatimonadota bacterium]|nr:MAG: hypothetical protein JSV86_06040 [Gemmatimonadota bacterium]